MEEQLIHQVLCDRYSIQSLLGRKAGRRTFLAHDLQTNQLVVIKLLLFSPDFDWSDLKLFEREAEVLQSLDHPAIPNYLDYFEIDTQFGKGFALVQTYIEAKSLQDWIQSGRTFSEEELETIAVKLLKILDYIHHRQPTVIHRDIKPSNILLSSDRSSHSPGTIYLVDFGSVQTAMHEGTITVVGTYGYMPPEQFGGRANPASDLYALGATLIYLATGQHPANLPQKNLQIEFEELTSLNKPFIRWIRCLTDPIVSERPASAKDAYNLLRDFYQISVPDPTQSELATSHPFSKIQIRSSSKTLEIIVPGRQLLTPEMIESANSYALSIVRVGIVFIILCLIVAIFTFQPWVWRAGVLIAQVGAGLWAWGILSNFKGLKFPDYYKIGFKLKGDNIYCAVFDQAGTEVLADFPSGELQSFSVERSQDNKYELIFNLSNSTHVFYICGERSEIKWLSSELTQWSGLKVEF